MNNLPLSQRPASVGSGLAFQSNVSVEGDSPGQRVVLACGSRELCDRLAACWNAQLGVPTEDIRQGTDKLS